MIELTWWALISTVVVIGAIGFFVGWLSSGTKRQIDALKSELERQQKAFKDYKQEVESHLEKSATLFISMAGSYKDLFEHLSKGYENLSTEAHRDLFKQRVSTLLLDDPEKKNDKREAAIDHVADHPEAAKYDTEYEPDIAETAHDDATPTASDSVTKESSEPVSSRQGD